MSNTVTAARIFNFDKESISFVEGVSNIKIKGRRVFFTTNPVIDSTTKTIAIYIGANADSSVKYILLR